MGKYIGKYDDKRYLIVYQEEIEDPGSFDLGCSFFFEEGLEPMPDPKYCGGAVYIYKLEKVFLPKENKPKDNDDVEEVYV